jgi:hypothetical protein
MANSSNYTPPVDKYSNMNLNALGSEYASAFSKDTSSLIKKAIRSIIYDTQPQMFSDLAVLNRKPVETVGNDEFSFFEMGYGRDPITVGVAGSAGTGANVVQEIPTTDTSMVSVDCIVVYPDNTKGVVTSMTEDTHIHVTPMTGGSLPAVASGDLLAIISPVERDAATGISQYFRMDVTERYNYIQMLAKAMRFGKMELYKYQNSGNTSNYIPMSRAKFMEQFRTDLSNIYWNGTRGQVKLADGSYAKTAGGIYPTMAAAGSHTATGSVANIGEILEDMALATEFKMYGDTRFLYATPKLLLALSKYYKSELTRYVPKDQAANLTLTSLNLGSTQIVFVPMKRFEDTASFPVSWQSMMFLLDQDSITPKQAWGEETGTTLSRKDGGNLNTFEDDWISSTFSIEFVNPLGCSYATITGL